MILARGGGSLEDLWPFNEEIVANSIYYSEIPIISAVGHETDFTIADFVADLRAPTPSAAAELAVADVNELVNRLNIDVSRCKMALTKKIELMKLQYEKCMKSTVFTEPLQKINEYYLNIDNCIKKIENNINIKLRDSKIESTNLISKLDALSPLKTLVRGYCIVEIDGKVVSKAENLNKDDKIDLRFTDGIRKAIVE